MPTFHAATFETSQADVLLVGTALFVRKMGEFERDHHPVEDHGRAEAGAYTEEEHAATLIAAESLHGGVVDEAKGLAEGLLIGEIDPSRREIMGLFERMIVNDRAGIAYGNAVVSPSPP